VAGDLVEFGGEVLEVVAKAGDQISAKPSS